VLLEAGADGAEVLEFVEEAFDQVAVAVEKSTEGRDANRLDAIVECGTNMSTTAVAEKLEPVIGVPILGINATLFWYALRENGFDSALRGAGRLLRER
jgi:maleate isomerase